MYYVNYIINLSNEFVNGLDLFKEKKFIKKDKVVPCL